MFLFLHDIGITRLFSIVAVRILVSWAETAVIRGLFNN